MKLSSLLLITLGFSILLAASSKRPIFGLILSSLSVPKSKAVKNSLPSATKKSSNKKVKSKLTAPDEGKDQSDKKAEVLSEEKISAIIKKQQTIETVLSMILSLFSMYTSRKIFKLDFKNAKIRRASRLIFCGYIALMQLLQAYLIQRINRLKDTTIVNESSQSSAALNSLGAISSLLGLKKDKVPVTTMQYDLKEVAKLFASILPELFVMAIVNIIFGKAFVFLLLLPMMALNNLLKAPIIQIHLLGLQPLGKLKRPFPSAWDLDALLAGAAEKAKTQEGQTVETPAAATEPESVTSESDVMEGEEAVVEMGETLVDSDEDEAGFESEVEAEEVEVAPKSAQQSEENGNPQIEEKGDDEDDDDNDDDSDEQGDHSQLEDITVDNDNEDGEDGDD